MKLADVLAEIDHEELTLARVVFTDDEHAALRERVAARIESRLHASYEAGSYTFLNAVQSDDAMPIQLMNWLATPKSRLKISRPIRPTTA